MQVFNDDHGGLLTLQMKLFVGQKFILKNSETAISRECNVVRTGESANNEYLVAVQFATPAPEFWPHQLPAQRLAGGLILSGNAAPAPTIASPSLYEIKQGASMVPRPRRAPRPRMAILQRGCRELYRKRIDRQPFHLSIQIYPTVQQSLRSSLTIITTDPLRDSAQNI
jgi:hypothetical protein